MNRDSKTRAGETGMAQWVAFACVGVGECQSEDSFVCFGTKPTQRACAQDLLQDWKKTREGKVPEQSTEVKER